MREQSSTGSWQTDGRLKTWKLSAGAVLAAAIASSCAPKVIVEPPPGCPELTEQQLELLLTEAPQELVDWYWHQFDPYCEALYEASRDHRE